MPRWMEEGDAPPRYPSLRLNQKDGHEECFEGEILNALVQVGGNVEMRIGILIG